MNIIENINERLSLADEDFASGGEQAIAQLMEKSPIKLLPFRNCVLVKLSYNNVNESEFVEACKDEKGSIR